jgi:hypothetical protein
MIAPDLIPYFAYFKHQCTVIPDLGHQETEGNRVFHVIDTDEAYDTLKNKAKEQSYQFRLLLPTAAPTSAIYNVPVNYGFIITHFHSKRELGDNSFLQAIEKAYAMGWRIINQMLYDAQHNRLFMDGVGKLQDLNLAVNPRISDIDPNYSGYIFTFDGFEKIKQCNADTLRTDYSTANGLTPLNFKALYADTFNTTQ